MTQEPLTVENLARALLAGRITAHDRFGYIYAMVTEDSGDMDEPDFDQLPELERNILIEEARLLLNRWMR